MWNVPLPRFLTRQSSRRPQPPGPRGMRRGLEVLEDRRMLSSIVWDNFLSDNFEVYGADAGRARGITIRAITDWARVIDDFNYDGGGNTFHLEISAGGGSGCGSAFDDRR